MYPARTGRIYGEMAKMELDELEERKNIRFEIGDLKDLATIMSKSEFLKTL